MADAKHCRGGLAFYRKILGDQSAIPAVACLLQMQLRRTSIAEIYHRNVWLLEGKKCFREEKPKLEFLTNQIMK